LWTGWLVGLRKALCVPSPCELMGFRNWTISSLNLLHTQNSNSKISTEIQLPVFYNWIGFEFQLGDWLLFSLCYRSSYQYHTDLCIQWASYTWNNVACTYILRSRQHNFYQIMVYRLELCNIWFNYVNLNLFALIDWEISVI
jgi:hypothetical protein